MICSSVSLISVAFGLRLSITGMDSFDIDFENFTSTFKVTEKGLSNPVLDDSNPSMYFKNFFLLHLELLHRF
jgi:hypothetical protein